MGSQYLSKDAETRLIDIVKALPGSMSPDIVALADMSRPAVTNGLVLLTRRGVLRRELRPIPDKKGPGRGTAYAYFINEGGALVAPTPVIKRKSFAPTPTAQTETIKALRAEVAELTAWKADAIARYPDLGVEPIILKARKIVADIYRNKMDPARQAEAQLGKLDNTPIMQATVAALETVA